MRKAIEKVSKGEIIVEGRNEIKVDKVEPYCCSSLGTHINSRYCYDRGSVVRTKDVVKREETGLGDLVEDYICPRCGGDHSWCQSVQPGEFGEEENVLSSLMGGLSNFVESMVRAE
jgi:hypothetical protein